MKKSVSAPQRVRIIGGFWRSRLVDVLDAEGLRPSTDRVRETIFNWLNPYISQASVIDLFAGTGVLGIEACSRGAKEVTLIEKNKLVAKAIHANLEKLQPLPPLCHIECLTTDAVRWLKNKDSLAVDIIFLDPPFDQTAVLIEALRLIASKMQRDNPPIIYVESSSQFDNETILYHLPGYVVAKQLLAGVVKAVMLRSMHSD